MFCLLAVLSAAGGWALSGYYLRAELRALDERARDLLTYTLRPGSPLACIAGYAGEKVESSCEDALFSTPQATAAAVTYVAAELSVLADANNYLVGGYAGYGEALSRLRRAFEADRFGFAAHVLSISYGCKADKCRAFVLLQDSSRIRANLNERTYESYVGRHFARLQTAADPVPPDAASPASPTATPAPAAADANRPSAGGETIRRPAAKLNFPSAASIPPISIMDPESPPGTRKR